mgnify:FL=1
MPILPLPQFEADLAEQQAKDKEVYDRLEVPKTLVVRFGFMKLIGEFPFDSQAKPGCGSKIVVKTHRGTEMGEMLTSTCPNSGCSKSVSRNEMLTYIERSGGKDYPFFTSGRALRVATGEDMDAQAKIEQSKHKMKLRARTIAARHLPDARIVEIEPLLGGERIIVHYTSEDRLDTRAMGNELAEAFGNRVDVHHVGARDEARLTADYEKCGQYCCCKNFLKVLKPVSMRSAKVQKATLDPMKISGRCGRLMCCLRYEDATYTELKKNLPHRKTRVGTPHGDGMVVDTQILTQLALVLLDDGERVAVPIEELAEPVLAKAPPLEERMKAGSRDKPRERNDRGGDRGGDRRRDSRTRDEGRDRPDRADRPKRSENQDAGDGIETDTGEALAGDGTTQTPGKKKKRRRKRRKPTGDGSAPNAGGGTDAGERPSGTDGDTRPPRPEGEAPGEGGPTKKKRRRRRKRKPGGGEGGADASGSTPPPSD